MLDMSMGPVHISSGPNSDSSLLTLSIILEVLEKNNKVIWMTRTIPDQRKISDVFGDLDYKKLNRMIVIEFGDKLSEKIDEINSIISNLKKEDLLIIEGWCDSHGRAKSRDIKVITGLANSFENKMAIISDSYQDASGQKRGFQGFMARGGKIIEESFRTIWTSRIDNQYQKILIVDGDKELVAESTKNGYKMVN